MEGRGFRTVCVAGGGIVALSAALAFARALPQAKVTILSLPVDPAALADRLPGTLADVHRFHAAIGLDELDLVRAGVANHRLGTRFERWSASDAPWYQLFGEIGRPAGGAPFYHLWLGERRAGRARPFHIYAMAGALAEQGKFVHPSDDQKSPLATFLYALRLDPEAYRAQLAARAEKFDRIEGEVAEVDRTGDGRVAAVLLKDGRRLEAELFIDCAGPSAPIHSALDDEFDDWSTWLPCDRIALGPGRAGFSSADRVTGEAAGWRWTSPLPREALEARVFASAFDEAGGAIALRVGRRPRPWVGNVLALGDAAVAVDPLHQANLHLAQTAILRALELLPGRECHPLELAEYNRRTAQQTLRLRDFLALHYLRSGRGEGELWREMESRQPPESLAHTLEQFEARGRLPFYEEESFDRDSWLAALLGLGVLPRAPAPTALAVPADLAAAGMERLAGELAAVAHRSPEYRDYLERMKAHRPRSD